MTLRLSSPIKVSTSCNGVMNIYRLEKERPQHSDSFLCDEIVIEEQSEAPVAENDEFSVRLIRSNFLTGHENNGISITPTPVSPSFFEKQLPVTENEPKSTE